MAACSGPGSRRAASPALLLALGLTVGHLLVAADCAAPRQGADAAAGNLERRMAVRRRHGGLPGVMDPASLSPPKGLLRAGSDLRRVQSEPAIFWGTGATSSEWPTTPLLEDFGQTVEKFIATKPTKDELLAAVTRQRKTMLGPVDEIPVQSCGRFSSARIYSPEEATARRSFKPAPSHGRFEDLQKDYSLYVIENSEVLRKVHKKIAATKHTSLRLAVLQWNALVLKPTTLELLAPFFNTTDGIPLNSTDVIIILLQENNKYDIKQEAQLLVNLQYTLNTLGTPDWGPATIKYLGNIIGTQKKNLLNPNTQSFIWITRSGYTPTNICHVEKTQFFREKGYIGAVFDFANLGRLAVLGLHLQGWKPEEFSGLLPSLTKACGSSGSDLDSFNLGVVIAGDWNEHMDPETMKHMNTQIMEDPLRYPAFHKLPSFPPSTDANLQMVARLTEALKEPIEDIEAKYSPLLWSADRLGRGVKAVESSASLPSALRAQGFSMISTCYLAGWTYKWKRGCQYPNTKVAPGHTPFSVLSECLDMKVFTNKRGAGYLDRVMLRLNSASTAVLDRIFMAGAVKEVPKIFAHITAGAQVYNLRSDHLMVANLIEFMVTD